MSQPRILSFDPSHISLANNLVTIWNILRVDLESIGHIKVALPKANGQPQRFKRLGTMVTDDPAEDTGFEMVNRRPYPHLIFFWNRRMFAVRRVRPLVECLQAHKHQATIRLLA